MKEKLGKITGDESFNYVLAYFTNTDPKGLTVLPIHRLVKVGADFDVDKCIVAMKPYFDVEEVKDRVRFFFLLEKSGQTEHVLGMYKNKRYWLLRLKNIKILDKIISDKPKEFRSLDVSILNYIVLRTVLHLSFDNKTDVAFDPNPDQLMEAVDADELALGFLLNPVKVPQMMSVAMSGEKMPPKSTYFYPKVLSGLVINKHD